LIWLTGGLPFVMAAPGQGKDAAGMRRPKIEDAALLSTGARTRRWMVHSIGGSRRINPRFGLMRMEPRAGPALHNLGV
jgi:hypothetical protein